MSPSPAIFFAWGQAVADLDGVPGGYKDMDDDKNPKVFIKP